MSRLLAALAGVLTALALAAASIVYDHITAVL